MSQITQELVDYIQASNAETKAWVDAAPGRWAGYAPDPIEDADFYIERGIFTVRDYEYDNMASTISDLAKEAYGTRSACPDIRGMSFEELSAAYDSMLDAAKQAAEEEKSRQEESVKRFEAKIQNLIEMGAGDRETAMRWYKDSLDEFDRAYGDEYIEYCEDLPYGYLRKEAA